MISSLTFRSLVHFEFIFVYSVKECSDLMFWHVAASFHSTTYWRGYLFSTVYSCLLCHILICHRCMSLFLCFLYCSIDLYFYFCVVSYCFDYWSFVIQSEVREHDASSFVFFFLKIALALQDLLCFHTNFRTICSSSVKNGMGILLGIVLNLWISLNNADILTILTFLVHKYWLHFYLYDLPCPSLMIYSFQNKILHFLG